MRRMREMPEKFMFIHQEPEMVNVCFWYRTGLELGGGLSPLGSEKVEGGEREGEKERGEGREFGNGAGRDGKRMYKETGGREHYTERKD